MVNRFVIFMLVLALVSYPTRVNAACNKPVTLLEETQPSPCKGYLFTPEAENSTFQEVESYHLLRQEMDIKNKQLDLYNIQATSLRGALDASEKQTEVWRNSAIDSTTKLVKADEGRATKDLLFIGLGVVLTLGTGWAVGQVWHK